jgi:lysophospholipase L1-like esterase
MNTYDSQPDIMAIGDSMYQGIRSLSFLPSMVQHSAPMQVAASLGMTMIAPDLQQPLLFDLEEELRHGGLLNLVKHIRSRCVDNLRFWPAHQPWSQHEAFDNVAIGGAAIASLWDETEQTYFASLSNLTTRLQDQSLGIQELAATIGQLWYALNTCYTLNPRHRPEQANKSQLAQVADRQPRILLINIGSNEGLFMAGFAGDFSTAAQAKLRAVPDLVRQLADRLKALPPRVERIVFNALIRPRFIPNLMPSPDHENDFPGDNYFFAYGPRIGSTQQNISNAQLRAFDDLIADVNQQSRDILKAALGTRVVFADIYTDSLPFDGKHYRHRGLPIPGRNTPLTNIPITPLPFGFHGGFTGLDNMHPTVPGYAVIADVVLAALGRAVRTDKAGAYAADTLLNNLRGLPVLIAEAELSLLGMFGAFRRPPLVV